MLLLSPFAPHLAEELWHALGHADTLAYEPWPTYDPALTEADEIEVPVQINGKVRAAADGARRASTRRRLRRRGPGRRAGASELLEGKTDRAR